MLPEMPFYLATDTEIATLTAKPATLAEFMDEAAALGSGIHQLNLDWVHYLLNGSSDEVEGIANVFCGNCGTVAPIIGAQEDLAKLAELDRWLEESEARMTEATSEEEAEKLFEQMQNVELSGPAPIAISSSNVKKLLALFDKVDEATLEKRAAAFAEEMEEDPADLEELGSTLDIFEDTRAVLSHAVDEGKGLLFDYN
jgi:hypothetical protein